MTNFLYTILADGMPGRCRLYWADGCIHAVTPDGRDEETAIPCLQEDAVSTIRAAWGDPVWGLLPDYGTVTYKGRTYLLMQDPYPSDYIDHITNNDDHYLASAIDDQGNSYEVIWETCLEWDAGEWEAGDESDACDWERPVSVRRL